MEIETPSTMDFLCLYMAPDSDTIIELLIQARMPFIETLLCVSQCRYFIMNPYPDLRGDTLDYYPYFTEEDIESGAFPQDGIRFQGQKESPAPDSIPHCDPTLPSRISSCALLLSWPSPILQSEAILLVYYWLLPHTQRILSFLKVPFLGHSLDM